jgi:hypothetical protein
VGQLLRGCILRDAYPVFPIFVTQTLGASTAILGLIEGIAEGTASVGKAISGRLADRQRRPHRQREVSASPPDAAMSSMPLPRLDLPQVVRVPAVCEHVLGLSRRLWHRRAQ